MLSNNIEKYKHDIRNLINSGDSILKKLEGNDNLPQQRRDYEMWYSESYAVIKITLPDRISDFAKMYYDDKTKKGLKVYFQYTPPQNAGWELMDSYQPPKEIDIAKSIFDSQIGILKSCERRFESSLFDIKQLLQSDIFASELDAAEELNKKGFTRGAGAVAGVVLEGHLIQVCNNHRINIRKSNPSINDLNQLLKDKAVIETPTWRSIQHLADLRNLCDHKKQKEPMKEEIEELIKGVKKINKTLY